MNKVDKIENFQGIVSYGHVIYTKIQFLFRIEVIFVSQSSNFCCAIKQFFYSNLTNFCCAIKQLREFCYAFKQFLFRI